MFDVKVFESFVLSNKQKVERINEFNLFCLKYNVIEHLDVEHL